MPLRALRQINAHQGRDLGQDAVNSSGRALVAAILAGVLAIGGGLAFAWYAARLVRRIRVQNEELRKHDRMKDDFVASVSHELRTPLTSIRGYLELLTSGEVGELNEEQERFLSVVDRNADRLLHVVGDLLFVSQAEAGVISTRVDVLADALRRLVEDPEQARAMGKAAREAALARYGLQRFLAEWDRVLGEVAR